MRYIFLLLLVTCSIALTAQNSRLANEYYHSGEYEKAAAIYLKLFEKSKSSDHYFNRYIESLLAIEEFKQAEKAIRAQIRNRPKDVQLLVTYGNLFEKLGEQKKADEQFKKAIEIMPNDISVITRIGNAFTTLAKYDLALSVYEKGTKLTGRSELFAYKLADLYRRKGESEKMIYYYLNSAPRYKTNLNNLINVLQRHLQDEDYDMLQAQLYERIQEGDEDFVYNDLLQWTFINRKQYRKAYRQARSMDRRNEENGGRVFDMAQVAFRAGDYDVAAEAFKYITDTKGENNSFYLDAKRGLLNSQRMKLTASYDYTEEDIRSLQSEYYSFLNDYGKNRQTAPMIMELANLEGLYLNNLDSAIILLTEMVEYAGVNRLVLAEAKISLADFQLMNGDVWESTLLYSQVDKDQKEGQLGELARYRNAMLSYYNGDFEWAQEQFGILKHATSRLISNDAIDMAVFILDNLGLDTTAVPLEMFAQADLQMFQNQNQKAFATWDNILKQFPDHGLKDDILYKKANIYVKQKNYDAAVAAYETIIADFAEEIRADNALYELATLYEGPLNDKAKAMSLYEKLFLDFSDSTYSVEARNKFRELRGDAVQ